MASNVYRYKYTGVPQTDLTREVPNAISTAISAPPVYQDITADSADKADLDAAMLARGWIYISTNPTDSVTAIATRRLIEFIGAPAEGWPTGMVRVISGGVFPTALTWWLDNTLATKVVEALYTRDGLKRATPLQSKLYDTAGTTVLTTVTDTVTYTGAVETSRSRAIA